MDEGRSVFLDAARFVAAICVVLYHALSSAFLAPPIYFDARAAVIVFFVISGYVIAYVSDTVESNWRRYLVARVSRIYIVVVPALLITLLADSIGMRLDESWYVPGDHEHASLRLLISLLFMNQSWNLTVAPLSNGPYWSICYEVFYYVIFGILCFVRRPVIKYLSVTIVAAIVGPRILLMFPVWLTGVACYRYARKRDVPVTAAVAGFILAILHFAYVTAEDTPIERAARTFGDMIAGDGYLHIGSVSLYLGFERYFLSDLYFGLSFAVVLFFSTALSPLLGRMETIRTWIRIAARYTFSIYLYHAPLLALFAAAISHNPNEHGSLIMVLMLTFASVIVLSELTEQRRPLLRSWLSRRFRAGQAAMKARP